jgi:hypothetical protein
MITTAQVQLLRIFSGSTTLQRWQSRWQNRSITWAGSSWTWQQFNADGLTAGDIESEGSLTIEAPRTASLQDIFRSALRAGHLVEVNQYEFDPQLGPNGPPASMALVASYIGEVVGMDGTITRLRLEIGSALSPIGVQFPWRSMTSQLIGVPCQL